MEHRQIKQFVLEQLTEESKLIKGFMIYQAVMVLVGLFFVTRPIVLAARGTFQPLYFMLGAAVFSFTILIVVHELLHVLALKYTGAPRVNLGGYLKRFIFYAEADRHVINRSQFALVAMAPLVVVKIVTLAGLFLTWGQPAVYFWIFVMSSHSLFCAGDIGMLAFFDRFPGSEVYTFDVKEEKKSYYFIKKQV